MFALCIGEGITRFTFAAWPFQPELKEISYLTEKDINLRWRFSPQDGRNNLGLRNREILQKENGVFRIMFLGDSLIWSSETSSGKLYTEVVEKNLNKLLYVNKNIEVINAGIPGYTTYQELEFLNVYGLDMQPDLVVLGFVFNDVFYKYLHRPTGEKIIAPEPESRLHRFNTDSFPGMLFRKSYLAHELTYAFRKLSYKLSLSPFYTFEHRNDFYLAWKSYGWTDTEKLIGKMHQQLADKNIPLVIVIFPISDQVDNEYINRDRNYVLYPQSRIKKISEKYDIPYMDLTNAIYQGGGRKLFSDYLHLTEEGNDIVASEITQYFSDNLPFYLNE
jgi:lysophospholipase L1-like esterase